ncbi:HMA2 domain-containing protein [Rubrivivax gelatinosus]|uniref:Uncharacterized protein n=1 Tax=Rubrivivax gelatinosus TaxID=28068 RepID=A0A4R2MEL8_RUBGE|nr:hypothetical protein [Rubrivivax gelatinosus]MBK1687591.1 hypothetical protein [Rubrivivax gelatinosus]TCP02964.1 hypothetical protein EV684_105130 [Rubrivivax gelatinosus]
MDTARSLPIVSSVPGRLRLRDARLRRDALRDAVLARLDSLPALRTLRANAAAGSVVVEYDGTRVDEAAMCREVLDAVAPWLPAREAAPSPAPAAARPRRPGRRRQLARATNVGMLASLGSSLALAAAGAKAAHVATGSVFLGLLGVHLAMHRRSLLR